MIIVGGGILGACLTLEAARRGLRPLLLERDDFGHATSWNSHRIVRGGFRHLQDLDLRRYRESVTERSWFLRHFPDLVRPLACVMPLDGEGTRRTWTMRLALAVDNLLSLDRNRGVRQDRRLGTGGVLTADETVGLFPDVRQDGLDGGALWYEAMIVDGQRVLMETLRWAAGLEAVCLNRVEVTGLLAGDGRAAGVRAVDRESGDELEFRAFHVVNAAGPWSRRVASRLHRDVEELFRPVLAFDVLFDREPLSDAALRVAPPEPGAPPYLLCPRLGRLHAGTAHEPWTGGPDRPVPDARQLQRFIGRLNQAMPGIDLEVDEMIRVYAGLVPGSRAGNNEPATREVIHDHGADGGPHGVLSVVSVEYAAARRVAERALSRLVDRPLPAPGAEGLRPSPTPVPGRRELEELARRWGKARGSASARRGPQGSAGSAEIEAPLGPPPAGLDDDPTARRLRTLAVEETALHLDDLLLRRGGWGEDPTLARRLAAPVCRVLGWDDERSRSEIERLEGQLP